MRVQRESEKEGIQPRGDAKLVFLCVPVLFQRLNPLQLEQHNPSTLLTTFPLQYVLRGGNSPPPPALFTKLLPRLISRWRPLVVVPDIVRCGGIKRRKTSGAANRTLQVVARNVKAPRTPRLPTRACLEPHLPQPCSLPRIQPPLPPNQSSPSGTVTFFLWFPTRPAKNTGKETTN